ncbi:hypothetical protein [Phenylobacterium sp.]|uniref:hypothetical protein n=1 Tax=Phenylobacterium sp. TaxID=1871053 RepID=UPI002FC735D9
MSRNDQLEFVRLAGAEIDDQAIAEIASLLGSRAEATPVRLIRLAASGPLIVARRPCGARPEIVGVAGLARGDRHARDQEIIAVDSAHAGKDLEAALRTRLRAQAWCPSLFRGRDRPPFGFVQAGSRACG